MLHSIERKILKKGVELLAVETFGRLFWPPCSVAVLVHGEHDDILVLDMDGKYVLPGGIIEAGEGLKEAARREVKEETGFKASIGQLLDIRTDNTKRPGIHFFFEGRVEEGEKDGSWEGEPEFVSKKEVKELNWELHHSHVHEYLFPGA